MPHFFSVPRIVMLVIASDNLDIYQHHKRLWRLYSKSHPSVSVFFIQQREDVQTTYIDGDTIWSSGAEKLERVFEKTIAAFQMFAISSYDFMVRTNLSSVWNFANLIDFCRTLPKNNVYCGNPGNPGISGAGMILSPDVVVKFVTFSNDIERGIWDDIDFGRIAVKHNIPVTRGYMHTPRSVEEIDTRGYHYYMKTQTDGVRYDSVELSLMAAVISKSYRLPH